MGMKQVIDYAERGLLLLFFVAFAVNVVPSIPLQPWNAVYLVAQSLQILFVLFRRQGEVSLRPVDWLV